MFHFSQYHKAPSGVPFPVFHQTAPTSHLPVLWITITGLRAIMVMLRVYPLHSERTSSFGDLYLPGSLYFCRTWMSCIILVMMDCTSYQTVWLSCHIFPHSYSDNYTFVFAILSLQAITIISYFLWKSDMPVRINAGYCVNSSRGLSIADADIFAHLIRSLSHLSHNCWGFFFPPMKWFCDYPLERSAKCQFNTWSELQTFICSISPGNEGTWPQNRFIPNTFQPLTTGVK